MLAALHCDDCKVGDISEDYDGGYDDADYRDEITGSQLSAEAEHKAREEELAYHRSFDA